MNGFLKVTLDLLEGFGTSCLIFSATLVFAVPLGLLIALGTMSRFAFLRIPLRALVWIIRGTPLMLQIIAIFYGPYLLFGVTGADRMPSVIIAFSLNYACYFSEIYRGGIESVPRGQKEAGLVLGMTRAQIFFRITLIQVVKRILPPMGNEIITLVKDTSLARVISVAEILMEAQEYARAGLIWPVFYTGAFYLVFVGALTLIFSRLEKKLEYIEIE